MGTGLPKRGTNMTMSLLFKLVEKIASYGGTCVMINVSLSALEARVDSRQQVGEWMRLGVSVINIFKKGKGKIRRGDETVWVPRADFRCRCPRLRPRQTYLIIGNEATGASRSGVVVDRSSAVHKWRDQLGRRLRRRMQRC